MTTKQLTHTITILREQDNGLELQQDLLQQASLNPNLPISCNELNATFTLSQDSKKSLRQLVKFLKLDQHLELDCQDAKAQILKALDAKFKKIELLTFRYPSSEIAKTIKDRLYSLEDAYLSFSSFYLTESKSNKNSSRDLLNRSIADLAKELRVALKELDQLKRSLINDQREKKQEQLRLSKVAGRGSIKSERVAELGCLPKVVDQELSPCLPAETSREIKKSNSPQSSIRFSSTAERIIAEVVDSKRAKAHEVLLVDSREILTASGRLQALQGEASSQINSADIADSKNCDMLCLSYADQITKNVLHTPRGFKLSALKFLDNNGQELGGVLPIKIVEAVDGNIRIINFPGEAEKVIATYTKCEQQQWYSALESGIQENEPTPMLISEQISNLIQKLKSDLSLSESDKAQILMAAFCEQGIVYSNDPVIAKVLESIEDANRISFLNGLNIGNCLTLSTQLQNIFRHAGLIAYIEGGSIATFGDSKYITPGHAQVVCLINGEQVIFDPTKWVNKSLKAEFGDLKEVESLLSEIDISVAHECYKLGQKVRDLCLKTKGKNNNKSVTSKDEYQNKASHKPKERAERGHSLSDNYDSSNVSKMYQHLPLSEPERLVRKLEAYCRKVYADRNIGDLAFYLEQDHELVAYIKTLSGTEDELRIDPVLLGLIRELKRFCVKGLEILSEGVTAADVINPVRDCAGELKDMIICFCAPPVGAQDPLEQAQFFLRNKIIFNELFDDKSIKVAGESLVFVDDINLEKYLAKEDFSGFLAKWIDLEAYLFLSTDVAMRDHARVVRAIKVLYFNHFLNEELQNVALSAMRLPGLKLVNFMILYLNQEPYGYGLHPLLPLIKQVFPHDYQERLGEVICDFDCFYYKYSKSLKHSTEAHVINYLKHLRDDVIEYLDQEFCQIIAAHLRPYIQDAISLLPKNIPSPFSSDIAYMLSKFGESDNSLQVLQIMNCMVSFVQKGVIDKNDLEQFSNEVPASLVQYFTKKIRPTLFDPNGNTNGSEFQIELALLSELPVVATPGSALALLREICQDNNILEPWARLAIREVYEGVETTSALELEKQGVDSEGLSFQMLDKLKRTIPSMAYAECLRLKAFAERVLYYAKNAKYLKFDIGKGNLHVTEDLNCYDACDEYLRSAEFIDLFVAKISKQCRINYHKSLQALCAQEQMEDKDNTMPNARGLLVNYSRNIAKSKVVHELPTYRNVIKSLIAESQGSGQSSASLDFQQGKHSSTRPLTFKGQQQHSSKSSRRVFPDQKTYYFDHLRKYHLREDPRLIDWKTSARRDELVVKQYLEDSRIGSKNIQMILDVSLLLDQDLLIDAAEISRLRSKVTDLFSRRFKPNMRIYYLGACIGNLDPEKLAKFLNIKDSQNLQDFVLQEFGFKELDLIKRIATDLKLLPDAYQMLGGIHQEELEDLQATLGPKSSILIFTSKKTNSNAGFVSTFQRIKEFFGKRREVFEVEFDQ